MLVGTVPSSRLIAMGQFLYYHYEHLIPPIISNKHVGAALTTVHGVSQDVVRRIFEAYDDDG